MCSKMQRIDLYKKGLSHQWLQTLPAIRVSETALPGFGTCPYTFEVQLLDDNEQMIDTFSVSKGLPQNSPPLISDYVFENYARPCRYVVVQHGGQDGTFWAGYYGSKMTLTSVVVQTDSLESVSADNEEPENDSTASSFVQNVRGMTTALNRRPRPKGVREVRLFVSSTFADFIAERDYLSRHVFIEVKNFCEKRGVAFNEIDLRWGVTVEQGGKVIQLCLDEIDKCRPYFMCMLGERYGWSQPIDNLYADERFTECFEYALGVRKDLDWIDQLRDRSTTELEIRHSCLRDLEGTTAKRAIFFFRDPSMHVGKLEDDTRIRRLNNLKKDIVIAGFDAVHYRTPAELGDVLLTHLKLKIADDFPIEEKPSDLDREWHLHTAFAAFRGRCYLPTGNYFDSLDKHIADFSSPSVPLVVCGASGSGKSALLANWWMSREESLLADPSILIVTHYIGSTVESTSHIALMRRVMLEVKQHLQLPQEIPSEYKEIVKMFPAILNIISGRCKMVLIIDALNQLEDRLDAFTLSWLPTIFPENVRVFLSTLPGPEGKLHKICESRNWPVLTVQPMSVPEVDQLIVRYLQQYGKTMEPSMRARLANSEGGKSPLFVRSLLEELRMTALYETLSSTVDYYLMATSNETFFKLLIERLEVQNESTEDGTVGVIRVMLTGIWGSRQGLSEKELLALTRKPRYLLASIFTVLHEFLVSRGGLLSFFHDHFKNAVERKYLVFPGDSVATQAAHRVLHQQLATFFRPDDELGSIYSSERRCDELPFQLRMSGDFEALKNILCDMKMLVRLSTPENEFNLLEYWSIVTRQTGVKAVDAYMNRLDILRIEQDKVVEGSAGRTFLENLELIAGVIRKLGFLREAESFYEEALSLRRLDTNHVSAIPLNSELRNVLSDANPGANVIHMWCYTPLAFASLDEAVQKALEMQVFGGIVQTAEEKYELRRGNVLQSSSKNETTWLLKARPPLDPNQWVDSRNLTKQVSVKAVMSSYNLALVCGDQGKHDDAIHYHMEVIRALVQPMSFEQWWLLICSHYGVSENCMLAGDAYEAEAYLSHALHLSRVLLGRDHPSVAVGLDSLARMQVRIGGFGKAAVLMRDAVRIVEKTLGSNHPSTAVAYNNLACMLYYKGQFASAAVLFSDALRILRANSKAFPQHLVKVLLNAGVMAHVQSQPAVAIPYFREAKLTSEDGLEEGHRHFAALDACLVAYPELG